MKLPLTQLSIIFHWCCLHFIIIAGAGGASGSGSGVARSAPTMVVSYVNGIYHTKHDWERITLQLQDTFQEKIRPYYNPSSGWWVTDATKAGLHLAMNDLHAAKGLAIHLQGLLRELEPDGRVLHIAHSGGSILTYLAAKHYLTYDEKSRIDVITFGGGRSITHKYFKGRVRNYYARNDPCVYFDTRATQLLRRTDPMSSIEEVRDSKHNTSFIYIASRTNGNRVLDHSLEGPTYGLALKIEAEAYKQRQLDAHRALVAKANMVRRLRKRAARLTGIRHFWARYNEYDDWVAEKLRTFAKRIASAAPLHLLQHDEQQQEKDTGDHQHIVDDDDGTGSDEVFRGTNAIVTSSSSLLSPKDKVVVGIDTEAPPSAVPLENNIHSDNFRESNSCNETKESEILALSSFFGIRRWLQRVFTDHMSVVTPKGEEAEKAEEEEEEEVRRGEIPMVSEGTESAWKATKREEKRERGKGKQQEQENRSAMKEERSRYKTNRTNEYDEDEDDDAGKIARKPLPCSKSTQNGTVADTNINNTKINSTHSSTSTINGSLRDFWRKIDPLLPVNHTAATLRSIQQQAQCAADEISDVTSSFIRSLLVFKPTANGASMIITNISSSAYSAYSYSFSDENRCSSSSSSSSSSAGCSRSSSTSIVSTSCNVSDRRVEDDSSRNSYTYSNNTYGLLKGIWRSFWGSGSMIAEKHQSTQNNSDEQQFPQQLLVPTKQRRHNSLNISESILDMLFRVRTL